MNAKNGKIKTIVHKKVKHLNLIIHSDLYICMLIMKLFIMYISVQNIKLPLCVWNALYKLTWLDSVQKCQEIQHP